MFGTKRFSTENLAQLFENFRSHLYHYGKLPPRITELVYKELSLIYNVVAYSIYHNEDTNKLFTTEMTNLIHSEFEKRMAFITSEETTAKLTRKPKKSSAADPNASYNASVKKSLAALSASNLHFMGLDKIINRIKYESDQKAAALSLASIVKYIGLSGSPLNLSAFLINLRQTSLDCNLFLYQKFQSDLLVIFSP
jgi:L-rhamnose mutarotase